MLQQEIDNTLNETLSQPDPEESLRCFSNGHQRYTLYQTRTSNYRTELEQLLKVLIMPFLGQHQKQEALLLNRSFAIIAAPYIACYTIETRKIQR